MRKNGNMAQATKPEEYSFIDQLIDSCKPAESEIAFSVNGQLMKFKLILDADELNEVSAGATQFAVAMAKKVPGEYADLTPVNRDTAIQSFVLSHCSVDPKITQIEALKLARSCASLFLHLVNQLEIATQIEVQQFAIQEYDKAKNELSGTASSDPA